ncbi:single-stranded DNA-binding protein [Candidatus Similichlamydia epinepheli]|uniref:single-stranded DNA-binding protein n=1 Tax=Candidatus Similichlamydia epinepheli TaxID=1903953 RepID=UPI000D374D3A|nr:single-stranded DNA-binding protein [Candidatus Similichlamydia epinepheli]
MASMNKVFLSGNLTRKPVLRRTPKGTSVTDLLLALNREYTTSSGKKQREACFVDVVVWGRLAEESVSRLECSSSVVVIGHLQLDVWFSKEGEKRCKLRVYAEEVYFLGVQSGSDASEHMPQESILEEFSSFCDQRGSSIEEVALIGS